MYASDQTIFRFEITQTRNGWAVVWARPAHATMDGEIFSAIVGPVERRPAKSARELNGALEITFDDPYPNSMPDVFQLTFVDPRHLSATYASTGFEPWILVHEASAAPLGPWDPAKAYRLVIDRPTNAEMTAIFEADQKDRSSGKIDWAVVAPADRLRQARTQALLDAGALHSGEDYEHAAFVFQHGAVPDDFLMAHILATVAVARGKPSATWIAAATLDRYLMNIGRPQIFGTQYSTKADSKATQEPYTRTMLSDALRQAMRVPPLAAQEEQRKAYERETANSKQ